MRVVVILAMIGAVLGAPSLEAQAPSPSTSDASAVQQTLIDLYRAVSAREADGSIAFLPPWTKSLPIQPGDSLKNQIDDGKDKQVVTLFRLDEVREVGGSTFITGSGYIEINGGGTTYSGMNRAQDPFIEITITAQDSPVFQRCEKLLTEESLVQNAIRIGGEGYFLARPGIKGRRLGVVRLDSVTQCELVPRR